MTSYHIATSQRYSIAILQYHNHINSYYHTINMLITRIIMHRVRSLRTPLDIFFKAPFDYGNKPERSFHKYMFYTWGSISGPEETQNMMFNAFEVNCVIQTLGYLQSLRQELHSRWGVLKSSFYCWEVKPNLICSLGDPKTALWVAEWS